MEMYVRAFLIQQLKWTIAELDTTFQIPKEYFLDFFLSFTM